MRCLIEQIVLIRPGERTSITNPRISRQQAHVGNSVARAPPGARSCRARPGISEFPIGRCDVGGLTACRLLESSADLHDVRDCLGHAHITTTSRYVRSTPVRLVQALARMEAAAETIVDADDQPHLAAH